MLIREITLRNLLSFGPETPPFALRNLNVLIGANGSGKSNFIEAIGLLQAAPTDISAPIRGEGGGIEEWVWKGAVSENPLSPEDAFVGAKVAIPARPLVLRHELSIHKSEKFLGITGSHVVSSEFLELIGSESEESKVFCRDEGRFMIPAAAGETALALNRQFDMRHSVLAQLPVFTQLASALGRTTNDSFELLMLADSYKNIKIYRDWSFGRRSPIRRAQPSDNKGDFLSEGLDNLGLVLNRFRRIPPLKKKFLESLYDLYPEITDFGVDMLGGMVQLYLEEGRFPIPATRLSDGTLRYLCLLAILCHPEPPPLVCIEEPELGMHPDALLAICKLIEEASERTQLIITTHSEFLVDYFTHDPGAIVVCEKGEQGTRMNRLDADDLKVWLKDYSLGNLWRSGQIGGNRW